jgi:hypothetical protein
MRIELPLPFEDKYNPHHFKICTHYNSDCECHFIDGHTEDLGYLDSMYLENQKQLNSTGTGCNKFNRGMFCPFFKWMQQNRIKISDRM